MLLLSNIACPPAFLKKLWVKDVFHIVIAILFFAFILLNRSPNFLRSMGLSLRTGFNLTVAICFLLLYITFRLPGQMGQLLALISTLALFAFSLSGLWAIGQTQSTIFSGIVPMFDASDYYVDALRLLAGQDFSTFSARRPLFPGLLSVVLWATDHNLMATLSVFTFITALACYATAKEIQRTHGAEIAVFVLIILFLFYRHHSGSVMSENLGLPLGALGFAFIWRGTADRRELGVVMGLFLFTLGLNARAGTFFMLPLLLLWGGWTFKTSDKKFSWKFFAMGIAAIIVGFASNMLMVYLLATPSGVPFANFSYSLYGLASGGESWIYVFKSHPELYQLQEPYQSREIYRMAFNLILERPALLIQGALYNWSMLFSNSWYSAYSFVSGENQIVRMISQAIIFLLCALGFARWVRNPDDSLNGLVGIAALGILISVPFLPPTDAYRMRPYATSMIVFGLLPGMGLLLGMDTLKFRFLSKPEPNSIPSNMISILTAPLLIATLAGPVAIKNIGEAPQFQAGACEAGLDLVSMRFDPGTHFNIIRQNEPGLDWMPDFHLKRFQRNSHSLPDPAMIKWAQSIPPLTTIFYSLDFQSLEKVLVVTPTILLPDPGTLWQACGVWEIDPSLSVYKIFYVRMQAELP